MSHLFVAVFAGDKPSPSNGDIWYNSVAGKLRKREAGVTTDLDTTSAPGSLTATTVEVNLGSSAITRGKFTITDAGIGATNKILCWQAPGPYTGKGTLADEAEMQPVSVIAVTPAAGSAVVMWETPNIVTMQRAVADGSIMSPAVNDDIPRNGMLLAVRIGRVRGNVKFTYAIAT